MHIMGQLWMNFASFFEFLTEYVNFGGGFLGFGCFFMAFDSFVISLLLGLCSILLLFSCDFWEKRNDLNNRTCSKTDSDVVCDSESVEKDSDVVCDSESVEQDGLGGGDEEKECFEEDKVFDLMTLREMVKKERERANSACGEIEKERMASASAAREAMAMILRLQSEKSNLEMEANQKHILAEKYEYDQDLIESLHWMVMKHESERKELEDQLMLCRQELKRHLKGKEIDQFEEVDAGTSFLSSTIEDEY